MESVNARKQLFVKTNILDSFLPGCLAAGDEKMGRKRMDKDYNCVQVKTG
jgi:hypothetical protein